MRKRDEASGPRRLARALGRRLSYANVTATLALFVALAGGSFAVAALNGQEKRVVKKIAKRQANKRITARAPELSVKHANPPTAQPTPIRRRAPTAPRMPPTRRMQRTRTC